MKYFLEIKTIYLCLGDSLSLAPDRLPPEHELGEAVLLHQLLLPLQEVQHVCKGRLYSTDSLSSGWIPTWRGRRRLVRPEALLLLHGLPGGPEPLGSTGIAVVLRLPHLEVGELAQQRRDQLGLRHLLVYIYYAYFNIIRISVSVYHPRYFISSLLYKFALFETSLRSAVTDCKHSLHDESQLRQQFYHTS